MGDTALGKAVWPILIALILFAFGASAWLIDEGTKLERIYEQKSEARAQGYVDRSRVAIESSCRPLPPEKEIHCIREENKAARQGAHDEYDLKAQLVTSVWTRQMGIAAIIAMAFGVLGVGLVFVTFQATREANVIARTEATRNAREADAIRKHVIQTERAILRLTRPRITLEGDEKWIMLRFTAKNSGKSNAWALQTFTAEKVSRVFPKKFTAHQPSSHILNAGSETNLGPIKLRRPKQFPVWIFGYLSYTTAHDATFKTFFCVRLDGIPTDDHYGGIINPPVDARGDVEMPPNT